MLAEKIGPTEIGKYEDLVKEALEYMAIMDVLVCGRCLNVFHFVEEYQLHKEDECERNTLLRRTADTKSGIWAYSLWKAAQIRQGRFTNNTSSWELYQNWVRMDDNIRETWIIAGKTIQSFSKLGTTGLQEMPVRISKTIVNSVSNNHIFDISGTPTTISKTNAAQIKDVETEKKPSTFSSTLGNIKTLNRTARRTLPGTNETVPERVEKIVAKRFNPRRKGPEYLVKWESDHLENSWEIATNLEDVPHYLELFEKQLARQKQTRAVLNAKTAAVKAAEDAKALQKKLLTPDSANSPTRPQRTSKTKAMDQVKQWVNEAANVGSTSPSSANEEEIHDNEKDWTINSNTGGKRKYNFLDQNDANTSDATMGSSMASAMQDLEEDLIPSHTVKRLKNGSSVSIEVKTNNDNKNEKVNVNGSVSTRNSGLKTIVNESSVKSADIIVTQDRNATGVVRKPGILNKKNEKTAAPIRILSQAERLVSSTGIVRANSDEKLSLKRNVATITPTTPTSMGQTSATNTRLQQLRTNTSNVQGRTTPANVMQRQQILQTRTPGGTIIQRRTVPNIHSTKPGVRVSQTPIRNNQQSPGSGRLIISRTALPSTNINTARPLPQSTSQKNVTPEEKIFNLSKSGDLKVTKKVMTREEIRIAQQQRLLQQQKQPPSQVQIQKVQQITPPRTRSVQANSMNIRSTQASTAASALAVQQQQRQQQQQLVQEEEEHQARLCPITGKLIGQEETQLKMEQEQQAELQQEQQQQQQQQLQALLGVDQQILTNEDGTPLLVRGEDGTVYQVAGKNAEGQTILVTQGADGEQQFAYVAAESDDSQVMTIDNAVAEAVAQLPAEQQAEALAAAAAGEGGQYLLTMTEEELAHHQAALQAQQQEGNSDSTTQLTIQTSDADGQEGNIPAEVVQADLPSPGGTRRVVLLLSDGTFMMTEMQDTEFKALNITPTPIAATE